MSFIAELFRRYKPKHLRGTLFAYSFDCFTFALSVYFAFHLRFDGVPGADYRRSMWMAVCIWTWVKSAAFMLGTVNRGYWRYTSLHEVRRIVVANTLGSILGGAILFLFGPPIPRSIYILEWLVSCFLTVGSRLAVRVASTPRRSFAAGGDRERTLIYGSGAAGLALVQELCHNPSLKCDVVGLIDDDPRKIGLSFHGKRVLGTGETLAAWARKLAVQRVLIAMPSASGPQMVRILKFAVATGVGYKMVPSLGEALQKAELGKQIRAVAVEDLLGRKPVHLDQERIRERIQGKVVMVTGAAGSIGSELCRQIARFDPLALVGFDAAETPLFQIERELASRFPQLNFRPEIGNITRSDTLRRVMLRYQPSIVYHAAAYKHVPMMERHVFAAVENNIFGTYQLALAAVNYGVEDFVMISSDKAVRPTSMMGATKRAAELVIRSLQREGGTRFVAVRFGNVLGSNGSVVPIFKEQIAAGGPITVTHPEMSRYFMTIPEASQLVLQAFSIGKGGEVFVLDMGDPVKIVDLARNLILLSGLRPDHDIKIQFSGLRPGEKLFEELNLHGEYLVPTSHAQIRSYLSPFHVEARQMPAFLEDLQEVVEVQDVSRLVLLLKELIPDYNPGSQLLTLALSVLPNHDAITKAMIHADRDASTTAPPRAPLHQIH
jgi:FlaA1/EpsC-like NDP-sugar epimerase